MTQLVVQAAGIRGVPRNRLFDAMTKCGSATEQQATNSNLDAVLAGGSRQLYHMLVLLWERKAFSMQRPIAQGEGLLVWRKLVLEYERDQPASSLGRMRTLMAWTFGAATLEQDINEFDVAVQIHERHGSKVPEDIMAAILVAGVQDKDLQQWLMVNAEKLMDYEGVKRHVGIYARTSARFGMRPEALLR